MTATYLNGRRNVLKCTLPKTNIASENGWFQKLLSFLRTRELFVSGSRVPKNPIQWPGIPKSVSGFLKMLHLLMSNDKSIFWFFVCWEGKFRECDPCDLSTKKRVFDGIYHLSSDCSDYLVEPTQPMLQEKIVKLDAFPPGIWAKKSKQNMKKTHHPVMMWLLLNSPRFDLAKIQKTHTSSPS